VCADDRRVAGANAAAVPKSADAGITKTGTAKDDTTGPAGTFGTDSRLYTAGPFGIPTAGK
jgi:hypothetical protein